jgi:hypothetical protein
MAGTRPAKDEIGGAISLPSSLRDFPRTALPFTGRELGVKEQLPRKTADDQSGQVCGMPGSRACLQLARGSRWALEAM